jgi:hypothetical protein
VIKSESSVTVMEEERPNEFGIFAPVGAKMGSLTIECASARPVLPDGVLAHGHQGTRHLNSECGARNAEGSPKCLARFSPVEKAGFTGVKRDKSR